MYSQGSSGAYGFTEATDAYKGSNGFFLNWAQKCLLNRQLKASHCGSIHKMLSVTDRYAFWFRYFVQCFEKKNNKILLPKISLPKNTI